MFSLNREKKAPQTDFAWATKLVTAGRLSLLLVMGMNLMTGLVQSIQFISKS